MTKVGSEVGKLTAQVAEDAETIHRLEKEKDEMSPEFELKLQGKDKLIKEKKDKLAKFVENRQLVQNEAGKVPTLTQRLRERTVEVQNWKRKRPSFILLVSADNSI